MKRILLAGAGHAHALLLLHLARRPVPGARITLATPAAAQIYSGMAPGYLAGHYAMDEITLDVGKLAARAGVELVIGTVAAMDAGEKSVRLEDGKILGYDFASFNVGSSTDASLPGAAHALPVKPLDRLLEIASTLKSGANIAVVGGGAAGVELAMALAHRGAAVSLYAESTPDRHTAAALAETRVKFLSAALSIEPGPKVVGAKGAQAYDCAVLATGSSPFSWQRTSGLAVDGRGYFLVDETLRSVSHPEVFAVGDCATLRDAPHPRSGVYAVRQAGVLATNIERAAAGETGLERFVAQRKALMLISCGSKRAIARWGALSAEGAWLWRLKDAIDRRWIERFR